MVNPIFNSYFTSTYTDGVGMISEEWAKKCAEVLGTPNFTPAAVQIRFAG